MATEFNVKNGPSQLDLMLALFDPEPLGQKRMVTFTLQNAEYFISRTDYSRSNYPRSNGMFVAEPYFQDAGPADYEIVVNAVERDALTDEFKVVGCCPKSNSILTITQYSIKKRSGMASIQFTCPDINEDDHSRNCKNCGGYLSDEEIDYCLDCECEMAGEEDPLEGQINVKEVFLRDGEWVCDDCGGVVSPLCRGCNCHMYEEE
ncbi:MAG TPA: hypothetical protein PLB38_02505 [bacterium]|nr:hypothetical protein [bacterium]